VSSQACNVWLLVTGCRRHCQRQHRRTSAPPSVASSRSNIALSSTARTSHMRVNAGLCCFACGGGGVAWRRSPKRRRPCASATAPRPSTPARLTSPATDESPPLRLAPLVAERQVALESSSHSSHTRKPVDTFLPSLSLSPAPSPLPPSHPPHLSKHPDYELFPRRPTTTAHWRELRHSRTRTPSFKTLAAQTFCLPLMSDSLHARPLRTPTTVHMVCPWRMHVCCPPRRDAALAAKARAEEAERVQRTQQVVEQRQRRAAAKERAAVVCNHLVLCLCGCQRKGGGDMESA